MPFIPINTPKQGFVPLEASNHLPDSSTPQPRDNSAVLRNLFLNNPLTGAAEAGLNLASQGVAVPASGLSGLAIAVGKKLGLTDRNPVETIGDVGEALTYKPRGEMGQMATEALMYPFEKLAEGGNWVGRKVQDVTGSETLATAADTAVNMLPMALAPAFKAAKTKATTEPKRGFTPVDEPPVPVSQPDVYLAESADTLAMRKPVATEPTAPRKGFTPLSAEAVAQERPATNQAGTTKTADAMPADGTVNSWSPGANYKGFIDDVPRSGDAMPAPDTLQTQKTGARGEPLRREDILIDFAKALDTGIYEGRVTKKGVMGFFRPAREEVRIKRHADLETAAHEMAHLIDSRVPEIRQSWKEGADAKAIARELKELSYDQTKVYEGFAEFVRHYMTQPDVAEAKAPTFYKWFDDFFANHQYGEAIGNARKGMLGWFSQGAIDRARSKIGKHRPMNDALNSRWDSFRQATVDDLHGVYRMEQDLTGKIQPNGAYESARLSRASTSIADGSLRYGAPMKRADGSFTWKGKGLEEILKPVAENLDDALLYFVGRSARELLIQKREHLFTAGEIKAMLDLRRPEFDQAFKEYQAWNEAVLDFAEAQGVINPEARMMWQRLEYMPFHRIGQSGGFKGKPGDWTGIKALTGGTENLRDILGNMTSNAAMLIDKAVKNEARTKIADLAESAKGGKFMVKIPAESRPVKIGKEAVIDAILQSMGIDRATNKAPEVMKIENRLRNLFSTSPEMIDMLQTNMPPAGGNVVAILKGGKPVWYEVNDPILLRALESIDRQPPPWIVKWLGLPKRIGQATITLTPDFMLANIARDTIAGSVMSQHGFVPVVDSLRGMAMRMKSDPLYKEYVANGGGLSSIYLDEAKFRAKLERFYNRQGIDYRTVLDTPDKVMGFIETLGDAFEMSTRLGEYRRAVEAGENPRHAAYLGREVSTDFAMRGDSKALGFMYDTVMFLKPAVLSWDRLYRGIAHDPHGGAIATKAGMIALSSAMLYLLNRGNPLYEQLPNWDKDANWHFFVGDQHFRYPKIWEIGAMASMAERSAAAIIDQDPKGLGKDFGRILATTYGVNLTPQIIAPIAEQYANKNAFTGSPIETEGMQNLQPFMRAKENTSETLKQLGMATRNMPEALQVNPVRAEALLRGYFNTWATYGLMLSDKALMDKNAPTMRTDQLPVVRRFYQQEPAQHTKYEEMYYDMLGEARRVRGTLRELDKTGRSQVADELQDNPMAREYAPLERANKNLQGINADMRQVRRDNLLTPDEKRVKLDALIVERNDLLKRTVEDTKSSVAKSQAPQQPVVPEGYTLIGYAKGTRQEVYQDQNGKRYTIE
ncbi:MAG: LPD38 domain-containing protein [Fluviibacter sp.]